MGSIDGDSGVVDAPIGRSASSPTRMAVSRRGKEARTRYRVERRFPQPAPATQVTVTLETGRTHQIRVHLAAIGHPVVGDPPTDGAGSCAGATITRPFLHAGHLALDHPRTDEPMTWDAPLPEDLRARRSTSLAGRAARGAAGPLRGSGRFVGRFEDLAVGQDLERLGFGLAHLADADTQPLGRGLQ